MNALWSRIIPNLFSSDIPLGSLLGVISVFVISNEMPIIITPVSQIPSSFVSLTKFEINELALDTYSSILSWAPSPCGIE